MVFMYALVLVIPVSVYLSLARVKARYPDHGDKADVATSVSNRQSTPSTTDVSSSMTKP